MIDMSDKNNNSIEEQIELRRREIAELERISELSKLAEKYNLRLVSASESSKQQIANQPESTAEIRRVEELTAVEVDPKIGRVRRHKKSWTKTVLEIAEFLGRATTPTELKKEVAKTHLGDRLAQTEAAFYGSIAKLTQKKELVRHRGWLFASSVYDKHKRDVESGEKSEVRQLPQRGRSKNKDVILAHLKTILASTTPELIKVLKANEATKDAVIKNSNPVYTLLKRMVENQEVYKNNGRYSLMPFPENEAPPGEPEDASENSRAETLLFDSQEDVSRRTLQS